VHIDGGGVFHQSPEVEGVWGSVGVACREVPGGAGTCGDTAATSFPDCSAVETSRDCLSTCFMPKQRNPRRSKSTSRNSSNIFNSIHHTSIGDSLGAVATSTLAIVMIDG
jgi:hypothetical protein